MNYFVGKKKRRERTKKRRVQLVHLKRPAFKSVKKLI